MTQKLNLPAWRRPEACLALLAALPPERHNRALYELLWCFEGDNLDAAQYAVWQALLHDCRFQGLQNVHHWLSELMLGEYALSALWAEICPVIDRLHPETCGTFGDYLYLYGDADEQQLVAIMDWLLQHNSRNARYAAFSALLRLPAQGGCLRPEWPVWLAAEIDRRRNEYRD